MKQNPQEILIDSYDYPLPQERIASHPLARRDACKLLVHKPDGSLSHHIFYDLPELLPADALLVYNNTRVINARMKFRKDTGALIEIFCLEPFSPADYAVNFAEESSVEWVCLVGNSKRWKDGSLTLPLDIDGHSVELKASRVRPHGNAWIIRFEWNVPMPFARIIAEAGQIPIPPYLGRDTESSDASDYQTVFSIINGSVAAPTAGLHFTPEVLEAIDRRGISRREVTLHVGAGTFQPVKSDAIGDHPMHSEFIAVDIDVIRDLATALAAGRPVIAVGTTSVRTLESLYQIGCLISQEKWNGEVPQWYPYSPDHPDLSSAESLRIVAEYLEKDGSPALVASTRIIIAPGYKYRVVAGMVTNFHQPRSTLLLLVSAFMGDTWRDMYREALDHDYRFLSYGDACLLLG
ncbi:MAG: S-adenosylmethionine:tRNA ribosyltransferase-isomerase [Muribaculaceae bacterium]|nr:S-adenosylmethionine:tRNA ribosyltransferase-isomerase [Muribaculaceae bacterium]